MAISYNEIFFNTNKNDGNEHTLKVKNYGQMVFSSQDISNITEICIPDARYNVPGMTGAVNLKKVTLPEGLTDIYGDTFSGCTSLETINIPQSLEHVWANAFRGCLKLRNMTFPETVTVDPFAFGPEPKHFTSTNVFYHGVYQGHETSNIVIGTVTSTEDEFNGSGLITVKFNGADVINGFTDTYVFKVSLDNGNTYITIQNGKDGSVGGLNQTGYGCFNFYGVNGIDIYIKLPIEAPAGWSNVDETDEEPIYPEEPEPAPEPEDYSEEVIGTTHILHNYTLEQGYPWLDHPEYTYQIEADASLTAVPFMWLQGQDSSNGPFEVSNVTDITFKASNISFEGAAICAPTQLTSITINATKINTPTNDNAIYPLETPFRFSNYPDSYVMVYYKKETGEDTGYCRVVDNMIYYVNEDGDFIDTDGNIVSADAKVPVDTTIYNAYTKITVTPLQKSLVMHLPNLSYATINNLNYTVQNAIGLRNVIPQFTASDGKYYRYLWEYVEEDDNWILHELGPSDTPLEIGDWDDFYFSWL